MKFVKLKKILLFLFFVLSVAMMMSCNAEKRFKILSFFFDGVPNPNNSEVVVATRDTVSSDSLALKNKPVVQVTEKAEHHYLVHPPYD